MVKVRGIAGGLGCGLPHFSDALEGVKLPLLEGNCLSPLVIAADPNLIDMGNRSRLRQQWWLLPTMQPSQSTHERNHDAAMLE